MHSFLALSIYYEVIVGDYWVESMGIRLPTTLIDLFADKICEEKLVKEIYSLPVYIAQGFWATSWWNLVHYGQAINNYRFAKFDFCWIENYQRYGSLKPAEYKMSAINSMNIF